MIDLNGNGISDVWERTYNANGVNPNSDPDGDGFSNLQEAIAGTNPFDSNSYPHIPIVAGSPTNFSVTLPCALGKLYQLQSMRVDDQGEMIDPWGTPYFFHQLSGHEMEIRSAGQDRKMWTFDDLVGK